jgi:hypothetical protein
MVPTQLRERPPVTAEPQWAGQRAVLNGTGGAQAFRSQVPSWVFIAGQQVELAWVTRAAQLTSTAVHGDPNLGDPDPHRTAVAVRST